MVRIYLLGAICIFSLVFLIIQLITYGSLSSLHSMLPAMNLLQLQDSQHGKKNLWNTVKDFTDVCAELKAECILIDPVVLNHLAERLESYSKDSTFHNDGHKKCHYFCNSNEVTFAMIASNKVDKNLESMLDVLGRKKFKSSILRGIDDRHQSLESDVNSKDIRSHLILQRGITFIHIILLYDRLDKYWSSTCSFTVASRLSHFPASLKSSKFCVQQNLISRFTKTRTQMDKLSITIPKHPVTFLRSLSRSKFLPCDMKRSRQFYSKYGVDKSAEAEVFRLKAKSLLFTVSYVLDRLNVRFWLSSGTCLGWFRQCDFIPHSKDLDIGIWIKDYDKKISEDLQKAGLVPKHIFGKVEDSFELSFRTASNDLKLDIFFFYEEADYMWNGGTQAKTGKKFKYRFPKFDICWTEFVDLHVRVPCNTLAYIEANYGPSWHLLIAEWDWKKSPSNVKENGVWPENELANVVQVFK